MGIPPFCPLLKNFRRIVMTASFITSIANIWNQAWPIMVAILIFGLIVIIHELGHFLFAKAFGVTVNEFAVGFGPALFKKKIGETLYALRLIPFGGYCAMEGEDEDSQSEGSFQKKSVFKRMIIVAAGGINNLILGLILVGVLLSVQGSFYTTTVDAFAKNAPSMQSGLMVGDQIVKVEGRRVYCASDISYMFATSKDSSLIMEVRRDGKTLTLDNVQFPTTEIEGKQYIQPDFGVVNEEMTLKKPLSFVKYTVMESVSIGRTVWMSLVDLIGGRFSMNEVMGPVGVVSTVSEGVSQAVGGGSSVAWDSLLYMLSLITINLGLMNLLPLPALDGGRLVFLLFEAVFRKPVPQKYEGLVHGIGLALLLFLILIITGNDILRLIRG
jgi:regulator of sigma E protease